MSHVELADAQQHFADLVERAVHGEDIVITKSKKPLVKLVALSTPRPRRPGSAKGLIQIRDDFDEPLADFNAYT